MGQHRKSLQEDEAKPLRLPLTPLMERIIREACLGDAEKGIEPKTNMAELARTVGLQRTQILRLLGMEPNQKQGVPRSSDRLPAICRALGVPESLCLPLSENEIEMVRALDFVEKNGGDVPEFIAAVKGFARVEAARKLQEPAAPRDIPAPRGPVRPGHVKSRGSHDSHK